MTSWFSGFSPTGAGRNKGSTTAPPATPTTQIYKKIQQKNMPPTTGGSKKSSNGEKQPQDNSKDEDEFFDAPADQTQAEKHRNGTNAIYAKDGSANSTKATLGKIEALSSGLDNEKRYEKITTGKVTKAETTTLYHVVEDHSRTSSGFANITLDNNMAPVKLSTHSRTSTILSKNFKSFSKNWKGDPGVNFSVLDHNGVTEVYNFLACMVAYIRNVVEFDETHADRFLRYMSCFNFTNDDYNETIRQLDYILRNKLKQNYKAPWDKDNKSSKKSSTSTTNNDQVPSAPPQRRTPQTAIRTIMQLMQLAENKELTIAYLCRSDELYKIPGMSHECLFSSHELIHNYLQAILKITDSIDNEAEGMINQSLTNLADCLVEKLDGSLDNITTKYETKLSQVITSYETQVSSLKDQISVMSDQQTAMATQLSDICKLLQSQSSQPTQMPLQPAQMPSQQSAQMPQPPAEQQPQQQLPQIQIPAQQQIPQIRVMANENMRSYSRTVQNSSANTLQPPLPVSRPRQNSRSRPRAHTQPRDASQSRNSNPTTQPPQPISLNTSNNPSGANAVQPENDWTVVQNKKKSKKGPAKITGNFRPDPERQQSTSRNLRVYIDTRNVTMDDSIEWLKNHALLNFDVLDQNDKGSVKVTQINTNTYVIEFQALSMQWKNRIPNGMIAGEFKGKIIPMTERRLSTKLYVSKIHEGISTEDIFEELGHCFDNVDVEKSTIVYGNSENDPNAGRYCRVLKAFVKLVSDTNGIKPTKKDWSSLTIAPWRSQFVIPRQTRTPEIMDRAAMKQYRNQQLQQSANNNQTST